jgi:NAD(P)-dependent dehydrogenase (short-subunit alcohol dehydrogenase family)
MASVLVTGGNRGIGLELSRIFSARGDEVFVACRTSNSELDDLNVQVIDDIDVGDNDSGRKLAESMKDQTIDVLVNNAGILTGDTFGEIDYEQMMRQYLVNALGPLRVTEALAGNLASGSKVAIVTSRVGSIEDNTSGGHYGYRASKTAVNQIGTNLKHELAPRGIAVALLHPGLVATSMTGGQGISAAASAAGLVQRIDELTLETSGGFWHAEGYRLPW